MGLVRDAGPHPKTHELLLCVAENGPGDAGLLAQVGECLAGQQVTVIHGKQEPPNAGVGGGPGQQLGAGAAGVVEEPAASRFLGLGLAVKRPGLMVQLAMPLYPSGEAQAVGGLEDDAEGPRADADARAAEDEQSWV